MGSKFDSDYINNLVKDISKDNVIPYSDLPQYDLFLSQVIDFLNDRFSNDKYTNNIVQNYIKSGVISKPEDGKKRGYTKIQLVELVLLSYMRPILTTEEIKKVFRLAFNEINDRDDDVISWESAYKIFTEIQQESCNQILENFVKDISKIDKVMNSLELDKKDEERIRVFISVMSLMAQASIIKKLVQKITNEYDSE
ncbi:DUF1836 domain-containing protein [Clostridium sp. SHJSY1]|uniref:DUF1836 domain-containing protein n=1 Tax=Clostridium sp. SHJSY1 TaxID=2942483 RepID=UPI002876D0C2|nr:DUF1836 domain-containing protein [Clostridium sp. SHJSY1]MDS0526206.1 DUF1836 domain-containing protein [Clostridium sp. SHJSY1]